MPPQNSRNVVVSSLHSAASLSASEVSRMLWLFIRHSTRYHVSSYYVGSYYLVSTYLHIIVAVSFLTMLSLSFSLKFPAETLIVENFIRLLKYVRRIFFLLDEYEILFHCMILLTLISAHEYLTADYSIDNKAQN